MNEAETRAEHIDPALKAAGWGVVEGSRIRREYPITPGRIEGHGRRGKPLTADYVLVYRNTKLAVVEAKAWDEELTEGVAQAKNYAGKMAIRFTYSTNGQGIYGIDMETGKEGELPRYPTPDELWNMTFAEANAWRDRFAAVPFEDKGGTLPSRYYPGHRRRAGDGGHRRRSAAHPAHAGHRHRQDLHRVSDRLEAVPQPLELEPRTVAPPAHSLPRRPQHPRQSGLQRLLRLSRGRAGADRAGGHPQEGQGAEERQPVLHHLPDLHERPAEGWQAVALFRRVSAGLLRLHRHRRVPSRRRERREQLARHPRILRPGRAARPHRHAQAQGQRGHLRLLRRAGLYLLAQGRHQRRLPHAVQGEADFHDARRVCLYAG